MTIGPDLFDSPSVQSLQQMYAAEYAPRSLLRRGTPSVPQMLNAIGACAGFASQLAIWRELILPDTRNPGDYLVQAISQSKETFYFGEPINQLLLGTPRDRLTFLNTAVPATLMGASDLPDLADLLRHVAGTFGTPEFGKPRTPPSIDLPELSLAALTRTWGKAADILTPHRPVEWPIVLGATARAIITANRSTLPPPIAVRILLEAAVPMSKLNPELIRNAGIRIPKTTEWSMRALRGDQQELVAETHKILPVMPTMTSPITEPRIAFANMAGRMCEAIAAQDREEIGGLFTRVEAASDKIPRCDVLFVYCTIEANGRLGGRSQSIGDIVHASGARIVVIASEIRPDVMTSPQFQQSLGGNGVNLVLVTERKHQFAQFFRSLFQDMWAGVPMPLAWVKLAPQGPHQSAANPGTICLMGAGDVTFSR